MKTDAPFVSAFCFLFVCLFVYLVFCFVLFVFCFQAVLADVRCLSFTHSHHRIATKRNNASVHTNVCTSWCQTQTWQIWFFFLFFFSICSVSFRFSLFDLSACSIKYSKNIPSLHCVTTVLWVQLHSLFPPGRLDMGARWERANRGVTVNYQAMTPQRPGVST